MTSFCRQIKQSISPARSIRLEALSSFACDSFNFYFRLLTWYRRSRDEDEQAAMFGREPAKSKSPEVLPCIFQLSACIPKHAAEQSSNL